MSSKEKQFEVTRAITKYLTITVMAGDKEEAERRFYDFHYHIGEPSMDDNTTYTVKEVERKEVTELEVDGSEPEKLTKEEIQKQLTEPFDELEGQGIVARHDYQCCQSCGIVAILSEAKVGYVFYPTGKVGYVFYHEQDTADGVRDGKMMMAFGPIEGEDEEDYKRIGRLVCDTLQAHGFTVAWEGSSRTRIEVTLKKEEVKQ